MAYQQKEGQGSLFRNDKQNDRQPDFRGSILIKGVLYNVSAWNCTSQNGREYISLRAEERQQQDQNGGSYGSAPAQSYQSPQQSYAPPQRAQGSPQNAVPTPPPPTEAPEPDVDIDDISGDDLPF